MTPPRPHHVLYIGSQLPKQSETFVYREVIGLRRRGKMKVSIASVHAPERNIGDSGLDELAREAIQVYPPGKLRLVLDAAKAMIMPRSWQALIRGVIDAVTSNDIPLRKRAKVIWQSLAGLALAWRVRRLKIDRVHAHMAHVPATIAMIAATALGVPFSFTGHAADLFRDRCLLTEKLRRACRVMCISHWHRRFYQSLAALPDSRLPVVRCGVDTESWRPATTVASKGPGILCVARLVPKKGIDLLIGAVAKLAAREVEVWCTIVGDGPERERLHSLANGLGVSDRVRFTGAQPNNVVRSLMSEHTVFALPCRIDDAQDRDGIPVVLMEAMACGLPVVSGELPTIGELIEDGVSGSLVPPNDVDALVAALHDLLTDTPRREAVRIAARRVIEDEFSLERNLARLESAFIPDTPEPAGQSLTSPIQLAAAK